ncbi:MAG: peptidoglycan-binding protein [Clostridia bacterium]|nr:peptidoglycan-binding protein [Clostridia bacterium]
MTLTASKLIEIAKAEVGYREKASNANLDSPTANAGSKNYTKYARDLFAAGYYNGSKNGYAWCDVFVDWCFYMLCGKNKEKAEAMECQTGVLGAGTGYSMGYYKKAGRFDLNPKVGDQIFFKYDGATGAASHTGIVTEVTASQVKTVEGNSRNSVISKTYKRGDRTIIGYGHPLYEENHPVLRRGSTGVEVAELQTKLIALGFDCGKWGADGKFGPATLAAVKAFQKAHGLAVDGVAGPKTWSKIETERGA